MIRPRTDRSSFSSKAWRGGFPWAPAWAPVLASLLLGLGAAPASAAGGAALDRQPAGAAKITGVSAGLYQSLARKPNGALSAWGWNVTGQLCNGNTKGSDVPQKVSLLSGKKVTAIAAGFAHSLVLTSTGAMFACGKNDDGELGNGSTADSDVPMRVKLPAGARVTTIAASEHDLAVTSAGTVLAWGSNLFGELGDGSAGGASDVPVNVSIPAGIGVTAVAAGAWHSLALTSTGAVLAWGYNSDGELGDGNTTNSAVPVKVDLPPGIKVTAIAAGGYFSLALTATGSVYAWGYNADGELGNGGSANSDVPVEVKLSGRKVVAIAAGGCAAEVAAYVAAPGHSLALTATGSVLAWGYNANGELGNGGVANSHVPVEVKLSGRRVVAIAAGQVHSLAVTSNGTVLAWGGNNFGQLGDGNYKASNVPVQVNLP